MRNNLLYVEFPFTDDNSPGNFISFVAGVEAQLEPSTFLFIFSAVQFLPCLEFQADSVLYTIPYPFSIVSLIA